MALRPNLSARMPASSAKRIPGRVNAVITRLAVVWLTSKTLAKTGTMGIILLTPKTMLLVDPKARKRTRRPYAGAGYCCVISVPANVGASITKYSGKPYISSTINL